MNINGIRNDGGAAINALLTLSNNSNTASADVGSSGASRPASSSSVSSVSQRGELMAKLSQLQQQDPAKFKQVTQQLSDELKTEAQGASGPQAQFLTQLSDNFAQASSTGSLASLQPPAGERADHGGAAAAHHQHGGHHGGGGAGGIESVLSKALDEVNQALAAGSSSAAAAPSNGTSSA